MGTKEKLKDKMKLKKIKWKCFGKSYKSRYWAGYINKLEVARIHRQGTTFIFDIIGDLSPIENINFKDAKVSAEEWLNHLVKNVLIEKE